MATRCGHVPIEGSPRIRHLDAAPKQAAEADHPKGHHQREAEQQHAGDPDPWTYILVLGPQSTLSTLKASTRNLSGPKALDPQDQSLNPQNLDVRLSVEMDKVHEACLYHAYLNYGRKLQAFWDWNRPACSWRRGSVSMQCNKAYRANCTLAFGCLLHMPFAFKVWAVVPTFERQNMVVSEIRVPYWGPYSGFRV